MRTSSATRSPTTWSSGSTSGSGIPTAARTAGRSTPSVEQAENAELVSLSELGPGQTAEIVRLAEHDGDLLHWFYDNGFAPGATVHRQGSGESDPLPVDLDGTARTIDEKFAQGLYVRPAA